MEKLLGMLGMMIVAAVVKARTAVENILEMFRGEDGFFMMIGICALVLAGTIVMLSQTTKERREAAQGYAASLQQNQI